MALVKVSVICPCCKVAREEFDETQMSDKEKYLTYWNIPYDTPQAEQAWKDKQAMTRRDAPIVVPDIEGHISMADGTWISSRSKHRENLKRNNCVEIGNDIPMERKPIEISRKDQEARKRQIAEIAYSKLKYR